MKTLIAHRGMSAIAPENTLAAFALCKENGIQWFECDVDRLHDGTVVVCHDDQLDRCSDRSGSLKALKQDDLAHIDAGSWFADEYIGERIPTLTELIALANQLSLNLNIEIKAKVGDEPFETELVESVIAALDTLSSACDVIVSSFNHNVVAMLKTQCPQLKVACLFDAKGLMADWRTVIQSCQADYIHPEEKGLTQQQIIDFKACGLKVNVWTVNHLARANQLFNWGVDGVCTDVAHLFPSKYKHNSA